LTSAFEGSERSVSCLVPGKDPITYFIGDFVQPQGQHRCCAERESTPVVLPEENHFTYHKKCRKNLPKINRSMYS
jgi:hypothetical protein